MKLIFTIAAWTSCTLPLLAQSDSAWPQFRGPGADGVLHALSHPGDWGSDQNVAWSVDVPGGGWSSPIVVGDRVFLTTAVSEHGDRPSGFNKGVQSPATRGQGMPAPTTKMTYEVRCYDLSSGAPQWQTVIGENVPKFGVHPSNTYATESPTTDGQRLFVTFGGLGEVAALDFDGEILWRASTGVFPTSNDFGWGSSLTALDGTVFLQNDNETESFVIAFDASSGEERWRADRKSGTSWATPTIWKHDERTELVTCGPGYVASYDPESGEELWRLSGVGMSFASSPVCERDVVYFGNSGPMSRGPLVAVRAGASGTHEMTRSDDPEIVVWRNERGGPGFPSPVVAGDYVYSIGSMGVLGCFDKKTGDRLYRKRLPDSSTVVATPWTDGKALYILDEEGKTFVVGVGEEFELLRVNELPGLYWATPSIAGDSLLLRGSEKLVCVRADAADKK